MIIPLFAALIFLSEISLLPENCMAQKGYKWGRIEIQPGVGFQSKYSDNIFLRPQANSDFIFTISPSLNVERKKLRGDNFGFSFKYLGEQELFVRFKDQDYYNQNVIGNIEFGDVAGDINLNIEGGYVNARNPISPEFASSVTNVRQIRTSYELNSNLLWKLTQRLKANFDARFNRNLFSDDDQQEYNQYKGGGSLDWKTTPLTGFGIDYAFRRIEYLTNSLTFFDSNQHSGSLRANWEPLSIFSSKFLIGLAHTEISNPGMSDRDDIIYRIDLNYKPTTTTSWVLSGFQEIPNSFWLNNPVYQRTAVQLSWNQKLGVKWQSSSTVSFEYRKYDTAVPDVFSGGILQERKDNYFSGLMSLTYSIEDWLELVMQYEYTNNDSNFQEVDYSSNVALLKFLIIL